MKGICREEDQWGNCGLGSCLTPVDKDECRYLFSENKKLSKNNLPIFGSATTQFSEAFNIGNPIGGGKSGAYLYFVTPKSLPDSEKYILKIYPQAFDKKGFIFDERPFREAYTQVMMNGTQGFVKVTCFGIAAWPTDELIRNSGFPEKKGPIVFFSVTSMASGVPLGSLDISKMSKGMCIGTALEIYAVWQQMRFRLGNNFTHWDFHPDNIFVDTEKLRRPTIGMFNIGVISPTITLIDFDLTTSDLFKNLLPENKNKKKNFLGITERALAFLFKWLPQKYAILWIALMVSARVVLRLIDKLPMFGSVKRYFINEDSFHIVTYFLIFFVYFLNNGNLSNLLFKRLGAISFESLMLILNMLVDPVTAMFPEISRNVTDVSANLTNRVGSVVGNVTVAVDMLPSNVQESVRSTSSYLFGMFWNVMFAPAAEAIEVFEITNRVVFAEIISGFVQGLGNWLNCDSNMLTNKFNIFYYVLHRAKIIGITISIVYMQHLLRSILPGGLVPSRKNIINMIKLIPLVGNFLTDADFIEIDYVSDGGGITQFLKSSVWDDFWQKTNHYPNLDNITFSGKIDFGLSQNRRVVNLNKDDLNPLIFQFECSELTSSIIFESSSPILRLISNFNISTNLISTENDFLELLPLLSNFNNFDDYITGKMKLPIQNDVVSITILEIKTNPILGRSSLTFKVNENLGTWIWNAYKNFISTPNNLFKKITINLQSPIWLPPFLSGVLSGDFAGLLNRGNNRYTLKLKVNNQIPCLSGLLSLGMDLSKDLDCAASISQLSVPVSGSVQLPSVYLKILKENVQNLILQGRNFIPTIDFVENKILKTTYPITQPFHLGIYLQYLQGRCRGAYGYDEEVNGVRVSQPIIQSGTNPNVGKRSYFEERGFPRDFVYQPGPIGKMVVDAEAETDEEEYSRRIKNPRKRSRRSAKKSENDWENFIYNV